MRATTACRAQISSALPGLPGPHAGALQRPHAGALQGPRRARGDAGAVASALRRVLPALAEPLSLLEVAGAARGRPLHLRTFLVLGQRPPFRTAPRDLPRPRNHAPPPGGPRAPLQLPGRGGRARRAPPLRGAGLRPVPRLRSAGPRLRPAGLRCVLERGGGAPSRATRAGCAPHATLAGRTKPPSSSWSGCGAWRLVSSA